MRPGSPSRRRRAAMTVTIVLWGFLLLPMSVSGVTVALPRIGADLGASGAAVQWVVTGYFLTASSFMLVAGSLGDLYGRRRVYLTGAALYAAASLASAFAPTIALLDVARTLTGIGAAGVMAGGGAILAAAFSGTARTRAFAAVGTTSGVGLAVGPALAGRLVDALGWRAALGVFAAAGLVLVCGAPAMPESRAAVRPRVDAAGAGTFIAGLGLVMFALTQGSRAGWTGPPVLGPLTGGIVLLAVFTVIERRRAHPVLDLTLLRNRRFMGWILAAVTMVAGFGGMLAYLPTYLQGAAGMSPGRAGLVMLMPTLPVLVMPPVGGRLINRGAPPRLVVTGALLAIAAGAAWLTRLHPGVGARELAGPLSVMGTGMGLASGVIDAQALNQVDRTRVGMAAGLVNTVRGGTQALVLALFGALLVSVLRVRLGSAALAGRIVTGGPAGPEQEFLAGRLTDAWRIVLWCTAGLTAAGALTVWALLATNRRGPRGAAAAAPEALSHRG